MGTSKVRIIANKKNALRHGLTGQGLRLPIEAKQDIETRCVGNLDATLDPVVESVTLGSFGDSPEPKPEIEVEPGSSPPTRPVESRFAGVRGPRSSRRRAVEGLK